VEAAHHLGSPVLCLASGEGRNAVWLARQGLEVHGVDSSAVGIAKTQRLAAEHGVQVQAEVADLATWDLGEARWGGIVAIFAHLPPPVRSRVHGAIVRALRPGGVLVMEKYTPNQLTFGTGGPPVEAMLYTEQLVRSELAGLSFERLEEVERDVVEGRFHHGRAAVLQVVARKPAGR
jgi:2-polyprenyl-3-methyl-5-hydroxy-6-metoxy-1,4-benzoquinol methylase